MPLDFGAISALSGGFTNWDAVRSMKERALQFREQSNNIEQSNLRANQLASAKIQEYEDTVNKAGLLEPDKKRVQAKEQELRTQIADGIKKFGGDAEAYLNSGGITELHDYQQGLINSDEMGTGLSNFYNHNRAKADAAAGMILRPVAGGKTYDEHFQDYLKGKTKSIEYNGAFEKPDFAPAKYFSEIYGNAQKAPQAASLTDVWNAAYHTAKQKGLNDADARQFAAIQGKEDMQYRAAGGTPYQYKSEDALKQELMRSQIYKNYKKGAGEGEPTHLDWLYGVNTGQVKPDVVATTKNGDGTISYKYRTPASLGGHIAETAGIQYDHKGNVTNKSAIIDRNDMYLSNGQKLDISHLAPEDIESIEYGNEYVVNVNPQTGKFEKQGIHAKVKLSNSGLEKAKAGDKQLASYWGSNNVDGVKYEGTGINLWKKLWDYGSQGEADVIIPINPNNAAERYNLDKKTPLISKNDRGVYGQIESQDDEEDNSGHFLQN